MCGPKLGKVMVKQRKFKKQTTTKTNHTSLKTTDKLNNVVIIAFFCFFLFFCFFVFVCLFFFCFVLFVLLFFFLASYVLERFACLLSARWRNHVPLEIKGGNENERRT